MESFLPNILAIRNALSAVLNATHYRPLTGWRLLVMVAILSFSYSINAQNLTGIVKGKAEKVEPLVGATLFWKGTKTSAQTDAEGKFSIPRTKSNQLIVSYIGYQSDTIKITNEADLTIILSTDNQLNEVVVRGSSTVFDKLSPHQSEIITTKALAKAACCNLSESFETNASISVNYTDAITGAKQIQMLGLAGSYIQMNVENVPSLRGLAVTNGLNYIPGAWIQSIDIGKGAGSVVNGYESMTGQINIELQKPELADRFSLNTYVNSFGRGEINLLLAKKINKKWSVGLLSHSSTMQTTLDKNHDNFYDLPQFTQYNFLNRWKYQSEKFMSQFGIKYLHDERFGGQIGINPLDLTELVYNFKNNTNRVEFFSKTARLFPNKPYKGLGLIINGVVHNSQSMFGFKPFYGDETTFYSNLIYENILGNTNHSYKAGLSYLYENHLEHYADLYRPRLESIPGAFVEYTFNRLNKFIVVAGGRVDFDNLYGTHYTPRLHIKKDFGQSLTLRLSAGEGWRVPMPLAEYYGNLASSRTVKFIDENIKPEVSWNYGMSLTKTFGKSSLVLDVYRTDFKSQLIGDTEHPNYLFFYNLQGKSYANSAQIELNLVPMERMEVKLAYRYFDVWQTEGKPYDQSILIQKMYVNRDRILFNIGYALPYDKWKFDVTVQWNGKRRIPDLALNYTHSTYEGMPIIYAPAFFNVNSQVTKTFKRWDTYIGVENLLDFTQKNPIVAVDQPFSNRFDAGSTWGPIIGRMFYWGTRYKIR